MAKIGFRVNKFYGSQQAGVPRCARNVISEIMRLQTDNEYLLMEDNQLGLAIPVMRYPISYNSSNMVALQCMAENVQIIHSMFDPCTDFDGNTKKILTIHDLIPMIHSEWYANSPSWAKWSKDVEKASQKADYIITVSESTRKDVLSYLNLKENKVKTIYNGLDSTLKMEYYNDDITSEKWSLKERYLLSVCTLEPKKNLAGLLKAYEIYRDTYPDDCMQLVIVGKKGWLTDSIFDAINNTPYADDVIVTGYVSDAELLSLYVNAYAVAYVSLYEGFGLPVLEGMALGKAVITSDTSSMPEVGGDAVCYCNPYEVESIADAIKRVAENESYKQKLEKMALIQAAKFTYENTAREILKLYDMLLD